MATQQIYSRGIYHGLPTFPDAPGPYTAIITGANGISGNYMLRVLAQAPERWEKIYCLSRRPPLIEGGLPKNAAHIACDFLKSPDEIAQVLQDNGVTKCDYAFFFSYIQVPPKPGGGIWSAAEELAEVNTKLLTNFLYALPILNLKPKRIMLQTGAKNYGGHLGPTSLPQEETAPRVTIEPNFYYPQEDALWEFCKDQGIGWNIHMPGPIIGAVPDAAMNMAFPLAVYAAVCKKMGSVFEYPGDSESWQWNCSMSASMLNAYQEEWAVLTPKAENQKFNTFDGGAFTWETSWPRIAGWYGLEWRGPQWEGEWIETETRFNPRGFGGKGITRRKFTITSWAKKEDVKKAWAELVGEYGLVEKELREPERVFGFLDGSLCRSSSLSFRYVIFPV
jgi:nucleoside-diphosphate-sugar epimerase